MNRLRFATWNYRQAFANFQIGKEMLDACMFEEMAAATAAGFESYGDYLNSETFIQNLDVELEDIAPLY